MSIQPKSGLRNPHQTPPQTIPQSKGPPYPGQSYPTLGQTGSFPHQPRNILSQSPNLSHSPHYPPAHDINTNQGGIGTPPPNTMIMPQMPSGNQWGHAHAHAQPQNQMFYQPQRLNGQRGQRQVAPSTSQPQYIQQPYISPHQHSYPRPPQNPNSQRFQQNSNQQPVQFQAQAPQFYPSSSPGAYYMNPNQPPPQRQPMYPNQQYSTNMTGYMPPAQQISIPHTHTQPMHHVQPVIPQQPIASQPQAQRKKNIITIKDPTTNADVTNDILSSATSQRQSTTNTPPSGRSSVDANQTQSQTSNVAMDFQFQVMALAHSSTASENPKQTMPPSQQQNDQSQMAFPMQQPNAMVPPLGTSPQNAISPPQLPASVPPPLMQNVPPPNYPPQVQQVTPSAPVISHNHQPADNVGDKPNVAAKVERSSEQEPVSTLPTEEVSQVKKVAVSSDVKVDDTVKDNTSDISTDIVDVKISRESPLTTIDSVSENKSKDPPTQLNEDDSSKTLPDLHTDKTLVESTELQKTVEVAIAKTTEPKTDTTNSADSEKLLQESHNVAPCSVEEKSKDATPTPKCDSSDKDKTSSSNDKLDAAVDTDKKAQDVDKPEQDIVKEDTAIRLKENSSKEEVTKTDAINKELGKSTTENLSENDKLTDKTAEVKPVVEVKLEPPTPPRATTVSVSSKPTITGETKEVSSKKPASVAKSIKAEPLKEVQPVNGASPLHEKSKDKKQEKPTKPSPSDTNAKGDKVKKENEPTAETKSTEKETQNGIIEAPQLKYDQDQWSPHNQTGKKQYDTNFLLQFQYLKTSLEKPKDLPRIDIVLDNPRPAGTSSPMHPIEFKHSGPGSDFTPNYMRHQHGGHNMPTRQNSRGHPRRQHMGQPKQEPRIIIKSESVELKRTTNAWKSIKERDKALSAIEKETAEVLRNVRSILNKLTPSKFNPLMKQVLELNVNSVQRLTGTIDLIFEKAIDEPNFSEAYAMMCRGMVAIKVVDDEGKPVEFRKLLLTKCQREFERDKNDQIHLSEMKKKYENEKDKEKKKELKIEYEAEELKDRRRTLGNIRFIGELFKLKMLTENIMHNCIMQLFKAHGDDHLESLCRLLTTIGKDLDHVKGKMRMDQYFEQMLKIVSDRRTTSSRVRFMLQDVIDLRKNNWVQRAVKQTGPKTINQIHQDAKEEQEQLQLKMAAVQMQQQNTPRMQNRPGSRLGSRGSQNQQQHDEGWTNVGGKQKPVRFDPTKMKMTKNSFDEKNVTLGPQQGFGGWRGGSGSASVSKTGSGGYSVSDRDSERKSGVRSSTPTMMNRFSALSGQQQQQHNDYEHGRRQKPGRQSSREGTKSDSRGSMGPPMNRVPRRDERQQALEATKKITSRDGSMGRRSSTSREASPSIRARPSTPQSKQAVKYTEYTEEGMEKKAQAIVNEFLSILDYKEAYECLIELNASPQILSVFVYSAFSTTLEKKKSARVNSGKLIAHMLKMSTISAKAFLQGVAKLLEQATDLEIDVPKVWEYYGEQLAPIFVDDDIKVDFSKLGDLAKPLIDENKGGIFVVKVLKAMEDYISRESALAKFEASGMQWEELCNNPPAKMMSFFYEDHNLPPPAKQHPKSVDMKQLNPQLLELKYRQELSDQISKNPPYDKVIDWVESNVPEKDRSEPPFLRALTTSVCQLCVTGSGTSMSIAQEIFGQYTLLLKKYLEGLEDRELQTLYAVQKLNVDLEQPPNVLKKLFELLYDEEIIQENSYWAWKNSTDPKEQEGHGVAVAAVNPFYTWLKSAEESD